MALIIGGHIRSGTTLLRNLCNSHPDIAVTMEFGNFIGLGRPYRRYSRQLLKRQWRRRDHSVLVQGNRENRWGLLLQSYAFMVRYLSVLRREGKSRIDVPDIEAALRSIFPAARIVGGKTPPYVFLLDRLAYVDGLDCLIVHRDCRDVTNSVLEKVRTDWRDKPFVGNFDTVEKIALRWVQAIELTERYADIVYTVRYEDLIQNPQGELDRVGEWLGVDATRFPAAIIRTTSLGKHKDGLSNAQLSTVLRIAGPAMARLGYL